MKQRILIVVLLYCIFAFVSISNLVFSQGIIGLKHDWSVPPYSEQLVKRLKEIFFLWNDVQSYSAVYPSLFYYRIFEAALYPLTSFNGIIVSKVIILVLMIISGFSMFYLLFSFSKNLAASFLSGLFYMLTPVVFNRVIAGYLPYLFSYSLAPLVLLFFAKSLKHPKVISRYSLLSGLFFGIALAQLQFLVMLIIILLFWIIFSFMNGDQNTTEKFGKKILTFIFVVFLAFLLHAFWIIPGFSKAFDGGLVSVAPLSYHEITGGPSILEAFMFIGYPHLYDYTSLIRRELLSPIIYIFLAIPISIGFLALIFPPYNNENKKTVLFASLTYILGIFLVTGINPPLGDIWKSLYLNLPMMRLFREVYHFMFLPAFSSSILLGFGANLLFSKIKRNGRKATTMFLLILLILISSYPLLSGNFLKQAQTYQFEENYRRLYSYLAQKDGEFRVLYLPLLNPILYHNASYPGVDPMTKYSAKPTLYPTIDVTNRFSRFTNFIIISLRENKTCDIIKLLSPIAVKFVIFRPNEYSRYYKYVPITKYHKAPFWNNNTFLTEVLMQQKGINLLTTIGDNIFIYYFNETTTDSDLYFRTSDDVSLIVGDWKTLLKIPVVINNSELLYVDDLIINPSSDITKNIFDIISNVLIYEINSSAALTLSLSSDKAIITPLSEELFPDNGWATPSTFWWYDYNLTCSLYPAIFTWATSKLTAEVMPQDSDFVKYWNFESIEDFNEWKEYTPENRFDSVYYLQLENGALKAVLYNSTWGWKTIKSPLISTNHGKWHRFEFRTKGENAHGVHVKIVEYNEEEKIVNARQVKSVGSGNFDWKTVTIDFTPESPETKYIQLQIWHGHETEQPLPNIIWIDNVKVYDLQRFVEPVTLEIPFQTQETGDYVFLIRYFKNQQGGKIQIQLDNTKYTINTKDQLNKFTWKEIDTLSLEKGQHKITLTNLQGFNAINFFTLIPKQEYQNAQNQLEQTLQNKTIIHILEAENDLYHQNTTTSNKYGGESSNGQILILNQNSTTWQNITITKTDNYKLTLKAKGPLQIQIDNQTYTTNSTTLNWNHLNTTHLNKGNHKIQITTPTNAELDVIWLYSTQNPNETLQDIFTTKQKPAQIINYTKINPTKYTVNINATQPFMLSFAEAYDSLWACYVNGEKISSIPLYSVINGFWINHTGQLEIVIEYEPQKWFYIGSAISIATLTACTAYLTYAYTKNKNIPHKIKQKLKNLLSPKHS